jgi:UDP-glucose 6-dehydrogenase
MRFIQAGHGEVGKAIAEIFGKHHEVMIEDPKNGSWKADATLRYDGLLVCFPYSAFFKTEVTGYIKRFAPEVVIIFSTVPVGTTKIIKELFPHIEFAHFPVEGKHPDIANDVANYKNVLGPAGKADKIIDIISLLFYPCTILENSDQSEFLKLRSLAYYAINIEFARASAAWAKEVGIDYEMLKVYDMEYNEFNVEMNRPHFTRYVLDPPVGPIGGHCVLAGVRHLLKAFPDDKILDLIDDINIGLEAER